ncbi:MAG: hypothetical protein PHO70_03535 [Candidatus Omnitrophica bacterium]|nr:hypothetical protein [Candidatus Omnitrophota bacterium]
MGLKQKIWSEFKTYWVNVLYITIFFSIFTNYKRLILAHYNISYGHFGISFIKGLVLAKVILIGEHLKVGQGFENRPLIFPTLFKSFVFSICVAILGIIEAIVSMLLRGGAPALTFGSFIKCFSYEWFAGMLAVSIIFIPFFGMRELGKALGTGKISGLFFQNKPKDS